MSTDESPTEPWIARLVDGEPLDWPALERALGPGSAALARMRRVAVLCAAMAANPPEAPDQRAAPAPAPSFQWGHLRVGALLGRGSSGEVHRAFDTVLQRDVALKLFDGDGWAARAFIAEARRLAQVRHGNVLAVHGAAVHDGRAGLWADLVCGRSLREWVRDEGKRTTAEVLAIGQALASALAAVHGAGLVHGDVKPANVMRADEDGHIVLMDFGSADSRQGAGRGGLLGSPLSMAPEQARGEPVGPPADMYGLGVTMHVLLVGAPPMGAAHVGGLARRHEAGQAGPQATRLAGVPRVLRALVVALLSADPARRPDATAVLHRLEAIAQAPTRRRKRLGVAAVIGSLAVGLGVAVVSLDSARHAGQVAVVERDRAEAANRFLVDLIASPRATQQGEQVKVVELLDQARGRLDAGAMATHPMVRAELWQTIGRSYAELDRRADARQALQSALLLRRHQHGAEDPRTLEVERQLALAAEPDVEPEAEILHWRDLHGRASAATGPDHPLPALIAAALGERLLRLGRVQEARDWIEPTHRHRDRVQWQNPLDRAVVDHQRLLLLQRLGEVVALLDGARELRAWIEVHAGPRHRNALLARNLEIGALLQLGRLTEAEVQSREMYRQAAEWLGERNPLTNAALGSWASALAGQGRTAEALPLHEKIHALSRERMGEHAPVTLSTALNLANALRDEGHWPRAEALYQQVIADLPTGSDIALLARGNLAELYLAQGRPGVARRTASEAVVLLGESLGPTHLFSHYASAMLGAAERGLGRPAPALALLEPAVAGINGYLGPDHPVTLKARFQLALTLLDLGHPEAAQPMLTDVAERRRQRLGPDHRDTRAATDLLAGLSAP